MFDRFFSQDNVIWGAMGKIFDLFVLNTLLILCSIPIFTIGPALTGFFYAMINLVRDEEVDVTKEFFRSFTRNFRQGVTIGLPLTFVWLFFLADIWLAHEAGTGIWTFFMFFFAIVFLFIIFTSLYIFPILAKFEKSSREILVLAFTLSLKHIGSTLIMLFFIAAGIFIARRFPGLLFILFGLEGMFIASRMVKIFAPWLPEARHPAEEALKPLFPDEPAGISSDSENDAASADSPEAGAHEPEVRR